VIEALVSRTPLPKHSSEHSPRKSVTSSSKFQPKENSEGSSEKAPYSVMFELIDILLLAKGKSKEGEASPKENGTMSSRRQPTLRLIQAKVSSMAAPWSRGLRHTLPSRRQATRRLAEVVSTAAAWSRVSYDQLVSSCSNRRGSKDAIKAGQLMANSLDSSTTIFDPRAGYDFAEKSDPVKMIPSEKVLEPDAALVEALLSRTHSPAGSTQCLSQASEPTSEQKSSSPMSKLVDIVHSSFRRGTGRMDVTVPRGK